MRRCTQIIDPPVCATQCGRLVTHRVYDAGAERLPQPRPKSFICECCSDCAAGYATLPREWRVVAIAVEEEEDGK